MTNQPHSNLTKQSVINPYLPTHLIHKDTATAYAPSNIALCKYWGKRNDELNLPVNGSLSISLAHLGTTTIIKLADDGMDKVYLNNKAVATDNNFAKKVIAFIDLFRGQTQGQIQRQAHGKNAIPVHVHTTNTIPTSAGLASSASGFCALMMAVNDFFCLDLPIEVQSAFARMGSGSASRSFYHGFAQWHKGEQADGMDSYAKLIPLASNNIWQDLRIGLVKVSLATKKIDSRSGMKRTVATSHLYNQWATQADHDLAVIKQAISDNDFVRLGETAEHNALSMHATMISTWPPVLYWQAESVTAMHKVWELREQGIPVYLTMDAGANLKLLFLAEQQTSIEQAFDDIEVIEPFSFKI